MAGIYNQYQLDIINGLNNTIYASDKISSDATFPEIISKINNIPTPNIEGSNSDIVIGDNGNINLGIGETVTLPAGYYSDSITVINNIVNRGKLNWAPTTKTTYTVPSGYYEGGTLDVSKVYEAAYNAGKTAGYNEGYNKGKTEGYNTGYNAGVAKAKENAKPRSQTIEIYKVNQNGSITFNSLPRVDAISFLNVNENDGLMGITGLSVSGNRVDFRIRRKYAGEPSLKIKAWYIPDELND